MQYTFPYLTYHKYFHQQIKIQGFLPPSTTSSKRIFHYYNNEIITCITIYKRTIKLLNQPDYTEKPKELFAN